MTLIAGFRCTDGFVIAADTAFTMGNITYQGSKLTKSGMGDPYTFCIAFSGDIGCGLEASQTIRDSIQREHAKSTKLLVFDDIKRIVGEVLIDLYDNKILKNWSLIGEPAPSVSLIMGVQDHDGAFGVLRTALTTVYEIDTCTFSGTGCETAYFAERLFDGKRLTTAITHHFAQQLFREIKNKGTYVGGNTEIFGRRSLPDAQPFFTLPSLDTKRLALWALDAYLFSAIRIAVSPQIRALPGRKIPTLLDKRFREIRKRLTALYVDSHKEEPLTQMTTTEQHTTEFGTSIGFPFTDL